MRYFVYTDVITSIVKVNVHSPVDITCNILFVVVVVDLFLMNLGGGGVSVWTGGANITLL